MHLFSLFFVFVLGLVFVLFVLFCSFFILRTHRRWVVDAFFFGPSLSSRSSTALGSVCVRFLL